MTKDLYEHWQPTPIDGPFNNAFAVNVSALKAGTDQELPFVSNALYVVGNGQVTLKFRGDTPGEDGPEVFTMLSGNDANGGTLYPFRVTKIISSMIPDGIILADSGGTPLADPVAFIQDDMAFHSIIALW